MYINEKEIEKEVIERAEEIARAILKGKDIYITKTPNGIVVKKLTVQKV